MKPWAIRLLLGAFLLTPILPGEARAQEVGTITGTVTSEVGRPIVGANVIIVGTQRGTITRADGGFLLANVPAGTHTIRAISIGYGSAEQEVTVQQGASVAVTFTLQSQAVILDEVVAVGYGTQQRVNVTGSVASVNVNEAGRLPVPTVAHALQALSPGLQILDGGGEPGRWNTDILVRGQGTLGRGGNRGDRAASRPLVLIDGIEGDLATLDMNDVENISVLKDASSAAIYGSRAANGVILVTTRRGQASDRPQFTYSGYIGTQSPTMFPQNVGSFDHMVLRNVARANMRGWCQTSGECNPADFADNYSQEQIEAARRGEFTDTDWFREQYRPAPIQDHTLRVTGGSESARYALTLDHMREDGMMNNTGANRSGVRLNTDFRASDRITGGVDVAATRRWDIVPGLLWNARFFIIHDTPPTRPVREADGTWGLNLFGFNPVAYAHDTGDEQRTFNQGTITGRLNYDLLPGWVRLQTLAAVRHENMDWERFMTDSNLIDAWPAGGARWGPNFLEHRASTTQQTTLRALLDYGHTFGEETHDVSGVFGYEQIYNSWDEFRAWRQDFYNNDLRRLNLGNADTRNNWGAGNEWALRSVFGRMNYSLLGRYLFEVNARYDGSSRFAEGRRFGLFPSFSAGWRISEEQFFNVGWIDNLMIRGSWGQLGNQEVPLYSYYNTVALTQPYWFGGQVHDGAAITGLSNQELSWETTTVTDIGFDAAFLGGRLSLSGDVYNRLTEDILLAVPIPNMVGRSAPFVNAGSVENRGWELSLGWRDAIRTVNYGIDLNLSDNRNEVVDLYGTGPYVTGGRQVVQVGAPINAWFGLEVDADQPYFRNQQEADNHAQPSGWITRPGDLRFLDQNGDGVINEDDRIILGDPNPRYMFGVNLNASWRSFDAGAFFQGVGKRDQFLFLGLAQGPVWENFTSEWHHDYYDPALDNQGARHPSYYSNYNRNYYTSSSHWVLPGRFVKLRNLQVGYNMPSNAFLDRIGVQRMRINLTGKNLWTHHNMGIDLDPEYPTVAGDYIPQTRTFSIGTELSF
jgi:TonB-linked SusC/RagA family outer membrane protein